MSKSFPNATSTPNGVRIHLPRKKPINFEVNAINDDDETR